MPIDDFFLKRKRNLDVPVKKRPPRKRFRRRGPGLLTTDTDLQKRLTSLMCETNSEDLLKGTPERNPRLSSRSERSLCSPC